MQLFVHRNEPNRPHISSVTSNFKERETKNQPERHSYLAPPPDPHLCISPPRFLWSVAPSSVWRPVVRLSAAGEGVFTVRGRGPQVLFCRKMAFFVTSAFFRLKTRN